MRISIILALHTIDFKKIQVIMLNVYFLFCFRIELFYHIDCIWKFQRYKLVNEFKEAPILPPPFSLLFYVCKVLKNLFTQKRNASKKEKNPTTTVENTSSKSSELKLLFL